MYTDLHHFRSQGKSQWQWNSSPLGMCKWRRKQGAGEIPASKVSAAHISC